MATFQEMTALANRHRQVIRGVADPARDVLRADVLRRFTELNSLLAAVTRTNMDATWRQILQRPEIQALVLPSNLLTPALAAVRRAHTSSSLLGSAGMTDVARALGLPDPAVASLPTSDHLKSVQADVRRNAQAAVQQIADALEAAWEVQAPDGAANPAAARAQARADHLNASLSRIGRRYAFRASLSAESAAMDAYYSAQLETYKAWEKDSIKVELVWQADFSGTNKPCRDCSALHGTRVRVGQQFPRAGTKLYYTLYHPPRHPRCRCCIVTYVEQLVTGTPAVVRGTASPAQRMSSAKVRLMSQKRFDQMLAVFASVARLLGRNRG